MCLKQPAIVRFCAQYVCGLFLLCLGGWLMSVAIMSKQDDEQVPKQYELIPNATFINSTSEYATFLILIVTNTNAGTEQRICRVILNDSPFVEPIGVQQSLYFRMGTSSCIFPSEFKKYQNIANNSLAVLSMWIVLITFSGFIPAIWLLCSLKWPWSWSNSCKRHEIANEETELSVTGDPDKKYEFDDTITIKSSDYNSNNTSTI